MSARVRVKGVIFSQFLPRNLKTSFSQKNAKNAKKMFFVLIVRVGVQLLISFAPGDSFRRRRGDNRAINFVMFTFI